MGERVLEGVLGIGKETRLVQELRRQQVLEPPLHRGFRRLGHCTEKYEGQVPTNDRGRLEQVFVIRGEPVDAGGQYNLYGRRDFYRLKRPGQPIGAPLTSQRARLNERSDALLDKERVPASEQQPLQ